MSNYVHESLSGTIQIRDVHDGGGYDGGGYVVIAIKQDGTSSLLLPPDERREAAQALAGDDYRVVPRDLTVGDLQQIARDAGVKLDMDLQFPADIRERCPACNYQPDRPEPVDPASVLRETGPPAPKMLREAANILETAPYQRAGTAAWLRDVADILRPEPDEAAVNALADGLVDQYQTIQDGKWRDAARALIRDHDVRVGEYR